MNGTRQLNSVARPAPTSTPKIWPVTLPSACDEYTFGRDLIG